METTIDLFEHTELLPIEVQSIIADFMKDWDESYEWCKRMEDALKPHGYAFEYYLDAVPFNLHKIEARIVVASQFGTEENILGFITNDQPEILQILHASILKGAVVGLNQGSILLPEKIREATSEDFETFRCVENGFKKDINYSYIRK